MKTSRSVGGHHSANSQTDCWISPRFILKPLGTFDLDPCACDPQPWPCATRSYNVNTNGLLQPWYGRVWLNPPYGKRCNAWLAMLANHGNGIALTFARTETRMFFEHVWPKATALLFLRGRITFHRPDGSLPRLGANSGGPSVLIAYGLANAECLRTCGLEGAYVITPAAQAASERGNAE